MKPILDVCLNISKCTPQNKQINEWKTLDKILYTWPILPLEAKKKKKKTNKRFFSFTFYTLDCALLQHSNRDSVITWAMWKSKFLSTYARDLRKDTCDIFHTTFFMSCSVSRWTEQREIDGFQFTILRHTCDYSITCISRAMCTSRFYQKSSNNLRILLHHIF